jgi:hypothetical protein
MEIGEVFHDIPGISGPIRYSRDRMNFDFGDTHALLKDGDEFLRRVRNFPVPEGQRLSWQLVTYVDPTTHSGHMGVFTKYDSFQYQSEFRIAMVRELGKSFVSTLVIYLISQWSGSSLK